MKALAILLVGLALAGCETVRFGLAFSQADTEIGVSYGDGKAVVKAEQGDQRVSGHFRR